MRGKGKEKREKRKEWSRDEMRRVAVVGDMDRIQESLLIWMPSDGF